MDLDMLNIGAMILCLFMGAGVILWQDNLWGWALVAIGLANLFMFNQRRGRNPSWRRK